MSRTLRNLCRLSGLPTLANAFQEALAVLVQLELGDDDFGGVDANRNALAVRLLADDTLNVDNVLETIHAGHFALTALIGAPDNGDLVILADRDGADLFVKSVRRTFLCSYSLSRIWCFRL